MKKTQLFNINEHNFTAYNDPGLNLVISSQIRQVSEIVLSRVKDTVSLILLGGYARGEGSVIETSKGLIPLGDYDFLLVTKCPHLSLHLPELEVLDKKFRVQYHTEVGYTWKFGLQFVARQIYWYEAKYGSLSVYGDADVLNAIPINSSMDIDLKEGFRLMFNRLVGMLRVFDPHFLDRDPTNEQKEHLVFQSVKGVLSCGESLLLLIGKYHYSYRKRLQNLVDRFEEEFPNLARADPNLKADFEKASRFKLYPSYDIYQDGVKLWFSAKQHILQTLLFFLAKTRRLEDNILVDNPLEEFPVSFLSSSKPELLDYMMFNWRAFTSMKSFKGFLNISCAFSDIVRLAIFYLATSITEDGSIDHHLLEKSLRTIRPIFPVDVKVNDNLQKSWKDVEKAVFSVWKCSRQ
jgi:hypothetical protein